MTESLYASNLHVLRFINIYINFVKKQETYIRNLLWESKRVVVGEILSKKKFVICSESKNHNPKSRSFETIPPKYALFKLFHLFSHFTLFHEVNNIMKIWKNIAHFVGYITHRTLFRYPLKLFYNGLQCEWRSRMTPKWAIFFNERSIYMCSLPSVFFFNWNNVVTSIFTLF